jgi:preprotein translocase subunit YajC
MRVLTDIERSIDKTETAIARLTSTLNELKLQLRERTKTKREKKEIEVGDRVIVTSRYRNRFGTRGTIVKVTKAQYLIDPDKESNVARQFRVHHNNVDLIEKK